MTYSNATFYLDLESGSDAARTALTSVAVANNGSGLVRCTKVAHGLVTGAVVDNTLNYTGAWIITRIDADNFDLVGSTYSTSTALTATPRGGASKADAWKTITGGATSARIAAGDTIRLMASPDETSIGNATWTNASKTVTLAGAVTANIDDGEAAWTASSNVTSTADTSQFKENTKSAKHVIASGFTTGLASFKATGTLNLSGYQQVSFWIFNTAAIAASTLSIRLCSDTAGVTTVDNLAVPAIPSVNQWVAITVDKGSALGSSIQSVALYCDLDPGAVTVQLDNIIACKASSSADSLSLTSLIGKACNSAWVASTAYATNDIRKPTQPNRNGYRYKVTAGGGGSSGGSEPTWPDSVGATVSDGALTWTCDGIEDTWYPIQSINGTTVKIDNHVNNLGSAGRGYSGTTETVATYKRECIKLASMAASSSTGLQTDLQASGTTGNHITYSGGWSRTDMAAQTGETWVTGQNGFGNGLDFNGRTFITVSNYNTTRFYYSFAVTSSQVLNLLNCQSVGSSNVAMYLNGQALMIRCTGVVFNNHNITGNLAAIGINDFARIFLKAVTCSNNLVGSGISSTITYSSPTVVVDAVLRNNASYGASLLAASTINMAGVLFGDNVSGSLNCPNAQATLVNCLLPESTEFGAQTAFRDLYIWSQKHDQTAGNHLITTDGGTIISATDQRNTASGISWKFRPTSTNRAAVYPLKLSIAKIACAANVAVTVKVYTRRDSTNINGLLCVEAGQLTGVSRQEIACAPTINTWVQSSALTFTPTEAGVVEIFFKVYDGVGTSNNFWIDDLSIS